MPDGSEFQPTGAATLEPRENANTRNRQQVMPNTQSPPTPMRLNCRVELSPRRRCEQNSQLAHDDCRRIRSTISETDQTDSIAVWLRKFWSILITFLRMASLCRHLSPTSIAQSSGKLCTVFLPTGAFIPSTRLNWTVESRRRRRCALGFSVCRA